MKVPASETGKGPRAAAIPRYELRLSTVAIRHNSICVIDRHRQCVMIEWSQPVTAMLLESGALPRELTSKGRVYCDRNLVWHLVLAAAATESMLNEIMTTELRARRQVSEILARWQQPEKGPPDEPSGRPTMPMRGMHKAIAQMMRALPGRHLTTCDIGCLLASQCQVSRVENVQPTLDDLVEWRVLQRIEVDSEHVFYDANTCPHWHVFDASNGLLYDADEVVFQADGSQPGQRTGGGVIYQR